VSGIPSRMISKSKGSRIADEAIEAGRRDRAWRGGFTNPLPHWFRGAHLAGLSDYERHARFDEMSHRALRRPGWVVAALAGVAAVLIPGLWLARFPVAVLATWPAVVVVLVRHYTLRREFKRDVLAFASRKGDVVKTEPTTPGDN